MDPHATDLQGITIGLTSFERIRAQRLHYQRQGWCILINDNISADGTQYARSADLGVSYFTGPHRSSR